MAPTSVEVLLDNNSGNAKALMCVPDVLRMAPPTHYAEGETWTAGRGWKVLTGGYYQCQERKRNDALES